MTAVRINPMPRMLIILSSEKVHLALKKPDTSPDWRWRNPMRTMILAAIVALSLDITGANAQSQSYQTPAHNYYQNNWMAGS
jgi:hypothetical protein